MRLSAALIVLGVFLIFFSSIIAIYSEEYTTEVPCVDGHQRVNLEGLMCEKKTMENMNLIITIMFFGMGLCLAGIILRSEGIRK